MKKYILVCSTCISMLSSFAQPIPREAMEGKPFGWMKVYNFKGAKAPMKVDAKTYSIAQLSICDSFANWMQASYLPTGGLGDVRKMVSQKLGLYNQNDASLPQAYGAYSKTYTQLKYNSSKKIVPIDDSHIQWSIQANAVTGYQALIFCTPTEYYFTLPSFREQGYDNDNMSLDYKLTIHPNTKKYFTYFMRNSKIGNEKTVFLFKDNKSPFIQITKGEYLRITEEGILREYQKEKKSIHEKEKGDQRSIDYFMKYLNEKHAKRLVTLAKNKERYKDRLSEPALIFTSQPDIMLENYDDVFEGNGGRALSLPVYKIDPAMAELCKTNKPQWIKITWHGDVFEEAGKHQHESIINNFNFDYVYNFFFDPEKVKSKPYQPLRSPAYVEATVVTEASEISKKNKADKNVWFFEDFSTTEVGKSPLGWKSGLALNGTRSVIVNLDGLKGNWALMYGNHSLIPEQLKTPLPENFTLSYDLIAAKDFTRGAKGLTLQLAYQTSKHMPESYMRIKLRPGFENRNGELALEAKFPYPPGYLNADKWIDVPGFWNTNQYNHIAVTIKKAGEALQLFINNKAVGGYEKAIPAAHPFNSISFDVKGTQGKHDKYYISNIKITRD
jgi:hypothetical protein